MGGDPMSRIVVIIQTSTMCTPFFLELFFLFFNSFFSLHVCIKVEMFRYSDDQITNTISSMVGLPAVAAAEL